MRRKMITVSAALALMLSVAGCSDKALKETTPAASPTETEAVNVTADETTKAPATTLTVETTAATIPTTVADTTAAESTTAPVTTAEETEAIEPDIPLNAEYFPDEDFCRFVSQYDWDLDGYLSPAERKAVTAINCSSGYLYSYHGLRYNTDAIHSLAGIQYFSELEELRCSYLSLTELDVTQNHKLKELNCSDTGLTELDVTQNTELGVLNCYGSGLTELDITHNPELKVLNCSDSGLTELDVTQNPKLTSLYCDNNKLTALDLSNNVTLFRIECYNNQLTSLDLSSNQDLYSFNCAGNSMSELNLSGLSKLEIVECFCNPSLKVNANNCSSPIEFIIDATASISGDSANFKILTRYDHAPVKDGYYFADLMEKEWFDSEWEKHRFKYGFDITSPFTEASADQNTLTIRDAHLLSDSGDYYDCETISLSLAQTVNFQYIDCSAHASKYNTNDFNTFYSAMIEEYKSCFSEETTGGLKLSIHILNGSIDEITIQIDQYP